MQTLDLNSNQQQETRWRLFDNEEESHDHLWLRCSALDADRQRLNLGASLDELVCLPTIAQALLRIILRVMKRKKKKSSCSLFYRQRIRPAAR